MVLAVIESRVFLIRRKQDLYTEEISSDMVSEWSSQVESDGVIVTLEGMRRAASDTLKLFGKTNK